MGWKGKGTLVAVDLIRWEELYVQPLYKLTLQYNPIYMYAHIEKAYLVGMELRPWDNIRINLSQNKPNPRSLRIKFEFLEIFEMQT